MGSGSPELDAPAAAAAAADSVERTLYKPPDPRWAEKEEALMRHIQSSDAARERELEQEPEGIDSLLLEQFDLPPSGPPDSAPTCPCPPYSLALPAHLRPTIHP